MATKIQWRLAVPLIIVGVFIIGVMAIWFKVTFLESGSFWDPNTAQIKPMISYRMEAAGEDWRLYIYKNPMTDRICTVIAGTNKMEQDCIDGPK